MSTPFQEIKFELIPYVTGLGVDVSAGTSKKLFRHWFSTSETAALSYKTLASFTDRSLNFVFANGIYENVTATERVEYMREWWRTIKFGGHLCLLVDEQDGLTHETLLADAEKLLGPDLQVKRSYKKDDLGFLLQIYRKTMGKGQLETVKPPPPENSVCVIRHGAIGDMVVASSVIAGLKKQGHYVVANTQQKGYNYLKHDPNIDEFFVQDDKMVVDDEMHEQWIWLKERYHRIVNLSETMEGVIACLPGRVEYTWPDEMRRKYRGWNYYEFAHDLAQIPLPPNPGFYATAAEKKEAYQKRKKIGLHKTILLWVMSGSATHKRIPHMDFVMGVPGHLGLLQKYPDLHIVLVGDFFCKILQGGWQGHPQVTCAADKWDVRETMAFLEQCDLVVGPETGVIQASGAFGVPTVVFLSHTGEDTLCRYWPSYTALKPDGCKCFPCYKQHYSNHSCSQVEIAPETWAAECQAKIPVQRVIEAASYWIDAARAKRAA